MKILVVDDEKLLVKGIKFNLENDGYEVVTGCDGMEAVELAASESPDLIVLDLMMPRLDGLEACTKIREFSQVPIIMLTAKSEDMDKLLGFEHGADDYLTKPFNILELKARIRALLRRAGAAKKQEPEQKLVCGHITLDRSSRSASREDVPVDLTAKEFDLMELLMRNPNRVYSRETLLDAIWGYDVSSEIRTVDVHIRRLREKLELNPAQPEHILTKWGVGYLLAHHQTGHAGILVQIGQRGFRDRHDVGQVPVLQRDQAGHDLGKARGIDPLVGVLLIDDTVRVEVDEQRGLGRHGKLLPG